MKTKKDAVLILILLIVFLSLGIMVKGSKEGILFDVTILDFLHKDTNPTILSLMKFISFIGSEKFLFPAVGLVILYTLIEKRYYVSKILLINTLGSFILNHLLKQLFQRTRPLAYILVKQGGLSYPSGHSMVTMSMYLSIAYLLTRNLEERGKKTLVYTIALLYILSMGLSRMYLGVHWPTDIIGGYIAGYLLHYFSVRLASRRNYI
ncbi:MAG TPA: phosphatase PAP2 family protein [Tissierellaceae bacterium]|nr:phosphatase PAP2 family protein [Tissierellaceae bacterium]